MGLTVHIYIMEYNEASKKNEKFENWLKQITKNCD
jgi:hypothetical protein